MRRKVAYIVALTGLVVLSLSSCRKEPVPSPEYGERIPVLWDITEVEGMKETKALIEDKAGLESACSATGGKSIGVWADYSILEGAGEPDASGSPSNGRLVTYENVFDNAEIVFTGPAGGSTSGWNSAEGKDVYWVFGGDYKFRAYYPHTMSGYITSNSDADIFILEYKSEVVQEDLCVAHNTVSTTAEGWKSTDPVNLAFTHCLSAVKFQFKMDYEMEDKLTSCYLENTSSKTKEAFSTLGLLIYGSSEAGKEKDIDWTEGYWPEKNTPFYRWKYNEGLAFDNNTAAVAYTGGYNDFGRIYTMNDGWLLIMPQESKGFVNLCFTTEKGGDTVYKVRIPAETGTVVDDKPSYSRATRYTYTVMVSKTNLKMNISVSDWNERQSSVDIIF